MMFAVPNEWNDVDNMIIPQHILYNIPMPVYDI